MEAKQYALAKIRARERGHIAQVVNAKPDHAGNILDLSIPTGEIHSILDVLRVVTLNIICLESQSAR